MVFEKKGMWKHPLSAQKYVSREDALAAYNALVGEPVEEPVEEPVCPVCANEECQCEDLSPLEQMWKSADPT